MRELQRKKVCVKKYNGCNDECVLQTVVFISFIKPGKSETSFQILCLCYVS